MNNLRQEVNDLFEMTNTDWQPHIDNWNLLREEKLLIFESIWKFLSEAEFSYEDCALEGTVMKRGQEQHGFSRDGRHYYSMREGQKHGLSMQIYNGWIGYDIFVHNNGTEVFSLEFDRNGNEYYRWDRDNMFSDLQQQIFLR